MRAADNVSASTGQTPHAIVVRLAAEMMIKASVTRDAFRRRLKSNVIDALKRNQVRARVQARYGRMMVWLEPGAEDPVAVQERATAALQRVFGIGSLSPVEAACSADLETMTATAASHFLEVVRGKRYAVRCKRSGHHPFGSMDVERRIGSVLHEGATVDLSDPEVTVSVEIDGHRALFFSRSVPGPGGLPLGSGGRALALFSGGYDSAVAAWHVMKRGVEVDFLYCRLGSAGAERRALRVAKRLTDDWAAGSRPDFHVVEFEDVVTELKLDSSSELWQVLLKRRMIHAAEAIADGIDVRMRRRAQALPGGNHWDAVDALVTGESIGQVSSQTLANLRSIDGAAQRPVLRPLIGADKLEIMRLAEHIGTAAASAEVQEDCAITPGRTATSSRPGRVEDAEAQLEAVALEAAIARARYVALRALQPTDLVEPGVSIDRVPAGAVLLDGRPREMWADWHADGARRVSFAALTAEPEALRRDVPYLLICQFGTRSEAAAEALRRAGLDAYSFRGGGEALRRYLVGQRSTTTEVGDGIQALL